MQCILVWTMARDQVLMRLPSDCRVCAVDTVLGQHTFEILLKFMSNFAIITDDSYLSGAARSSFPPNVVQYTLDAGAEEHKAAMLVELLGGDPANLEQTQATDSEPSPKEGRPRAQAINGIAQAVIFCNSNDKVDWLHERLAACNMPYGTHPLSLSYSSQVDLWAQVSGSARGHGSRGSPAWGRLVEDWRGTPPHHHGFAYDWYSSQVHVKTKV
jgi:hypothetical protein